MTPREALEKLYKAKCTISGMVTEKVDGETVTKEVVIIENQACRVSHSSSPSSKQGEVISEADRSIKLFIAPEINVPIGSKVVVNQCDRVYKLKASGFPSVYPTHQEVTLTEEGKA